MLIVPASKVSVPFTVVMRTRSSVPERAIFPAVVPTVADACRPIQPFAVQLLPVVKVKTIEPTYKEEADGEKTVTSNPLLIFEPPDA